MTAHPREVLALGIAFHGVIEVTARVESFSWLMLASYSLFFLPELGASCARFGRHSASTIK